MIVSKLGGKDMTNRIQGIDEKLAELQDRYQKLLDEPQGLRPPRIQKDRLDGIIKQMDKLDAEKESLVSSSS